MSRLSGKVDHCYKYRVLVAVYALTLYLNWMNAAVVRARSQNWAI